MRKESRGKIVAAALVVGGALLVAGFGLAFGRQEMEPSWRPEVEGLLATVNTEANRIGLVPEDARQVQPATAAEAAAWLNSWPYRARGDRSAKNEAPLLVGAQSAEVRCTGPQHAEAGIVPDGDDVGTLAAIRQRRECEYVKWKVWTGETAELRQNERHTVWVDEAGRFRGRVDYWR